MPALLANVVTRIVVPVTALPCQDASEPCQDTFALETMGRALRDRAAALGAGRADAAEGIARVQAACAVVAAVLRQSAQARVRQRCRCGSV